MNQQSNESTSHHPGSSPSEPSGDSQGTARMWEPDPFPQPRTIPTGWDLSEMLERVESANQRPSYPAGNPQESSLGLELAENHSGDLEL
jgi:hypothetical protein